MSNAPDTVTAAVEILRGDGYTDDVELIDGHLCWAGDTWRCTLDEASVERTYRFEGPSDPGDEMIVVGITSSSGAKGVLVSAFGPGADPALPDLLRFGGER
ncbi:MAG: hypothetical protein ACK5OX_01675 [Desertimonas sp.]